MFENMSFTFYTKLTSVLAITFACITCAPDKTPDKTPDNNNDNTEEPATLGPKVTSINLDKSLLLLEVGDAAKLNVKSVFPKNAADNSYTWSSSDDAIASVHYTGIVTANSKGKATIMATANDGSGVFASCAVEVCKIDVPQAIDMGTVVNNKNIKWASFNIGASSPEEYGLYYAWGETTAKSDYSPITYKFGTGTSSQLSKYNTNSSYGPVDKKVVLDPEDDVAHEKLGGKWRMPTIDEWNVLSKQCTWTWTMQNGVYGQLVTAPNNNSIFLPAAGYRYNYYFVLNAEYGFYWSSSLTADEPKDASSLFFSSTGSLVYPDGALRWDGLSIRPVTE